jgi:hypothetical protein
VAKYGESTLDVIEHETEKLTEVEGIGEKRVQMIKKAWEEQKEVRHVMLFLQGHGVSAAYASKIFKAYGNNAVQVVQENPYRLAADIFGIDFVTADSIARKLGFSMESEFRIQAGILYVLHQLADEGHVFYPRQDKLDDFYFMQEEDPEKTLDKIFQKCRPAHQCISLEIGAGKRKAMIDPDYKAASPGCHINNPLGYFLSRPILGYGYKTRLSRRGHGALGGGDGGLGVEERSVGAALEDELLLSGLILLPELTLPIHGPPPGLGRSHKVLQPGV